MVDGPDNKGRFAGELLISTEAPDVKLPEWSCKAQRATRAGRCERDEGKRADGPRNHRFKQSRQGTPTGSMGCRSGRAVALLAVVLVVVVLWHLDWILDLCYCCC